TGAFNGQEGSTSLPKNNIEIGKVTAVLNDFDFELNIEVKSFKMKVPGQATINCSGNRLSSQAKEAVRKARRGDGILFFDIKADIVGNSAYKLPTVSPVMVEVAN
ncbi:MAG TPA: GldM family protein, partial [Flavobacteriaceae bacterium]|nr:GldM family protein [Flavobacteriaceae bacterium]